MSCSTLFVRDQAIQKQLRMNDQHFNVLSYDSVRSVAQTYLRPKSDTWMRLKTVSSP